MIKDNVKSYLEGQEYKITPGIFSVNTKYINSEFLEEDIRMNTPTSSDKLKSILNDIMQMCDLYEVSASFRADLLKAAAEAYKVDNTMSISSSGNWKTAPVNLSNKLSYNDGPVFEEIKTIIAETISSAQSNVALIEPNPMPYMRYSK